MGRKITEYHGLYKQPYEPFKLNKIIFLDIDGVLVNRAMMMKEFREDDMHDFDPHCMKFLENIIDATDAWIVISSVWRKRDLEYLRQIFLLRGFKHWDRIIGETCRGYHFKTKEYIPLEFFRGNEIDAWIRLFVEMDKDFNHVKDAQYHYVILDDDSDMLYWQRDNFVKTTFEIGLTEQNAKDAVKILSGFKINNE